MVYLAIDGDRIATDIDRASLLDQPDEVRKISQFLNSGNTVWTAWCERIHGTLVDCSGTAIRMIVDPVHLAELPQLRGAYEGAAKHTCSVGVGTKLSDATKALNVAQKRGGDRIVLFTPDILKELEDDTKDKGVMDDDLALGKAEDAPAATAAPQAPAASEPPQQEAPQETQVQEEPQQSFEDQFHAHAQASQNGASSKEALKQGIVQALSAAKQQMPNIAQLAQVNPDLFQTVTGTIQTLVEMARELFGSEEPQEVAKAEKEEVPKVEPLKKRRLPGTHRHLRYLPGTVRNGKIKVIEPDTKHTSWKSVRSGMISSNDGHPISSRNPNGK